mgnify:CR=1 FL=1
MAEDKKKEKQPDLRLFGSDTDPKALNAARRNLADSVIVSYVDAAGQPVVTWQRTPFSAALVRSRQEQLEDWIAVLIANHLFSAADGYVASLLWDLPAEVSVTSMRGPSGELMGGLWEVPGGGPAQTNAETPVTARPTMRALISSWVRPLVAVTWIALSLWRPSKLMVSCRAIAAAEFSASLKFAACASCGLPANRCGA